MNKTIKSTFVLLTAICGLPLAIYAQKQEWHMKSFEKDKIYGAGVSRAYEELLSGKTPSRVVVAILDGGIDTAHEDLKANLWRNPKERFGSEDLDGNGYKGDVLGWNFLGGPNGQVTTESLEYQRVYFKYKPLFENKSEKDIKKKDRELYQQWLLSKSLLKNTDVTAPVDYRAKHVTDDYNNIKDRYYGNADLTGEPYMHGTHVGGIVGAVRNNDKGMDGIAPAVQLMGIRVVPNGDEHDKDVALGIRYAVDNGAHIINMSFGKKVSPQRKMVEDAIRYANKKGVLIVAAAGNDGLDVDSLPHYPTAFYKKGKKRAPNMISVGASGPKAEAIIAPFSNYGDQTVDLFAPGVMIYAPVPDNQYKALSGTSMASPVVAGVAALIKGYYPKLKPAQIKSILEQSVTKIDFPVVKPKSGGKKVSMTELCRTGGIVNAYEALRLAESMSK